MLMACVALPVIQRLRLLLNGMAAGLLFALQAAHANGRDSCFCSGTFRDTSGTVTISRLRYPSFSSNS
jgi:hypothetical protein